MPSPSHPLHFVLVALAGWINQQQRDVIDYLQEENRVLREQIGARRLRFTDDQRRRLSARARTLGRRLLREIATIVIPHTLLVWHRTLIDEQYDGSRGPGRPPVMSEIRVDRADGHREPRLGLHADPRSPREPESRGVPIEKPIRPIGL